VGVNPRRLSPGMVRAERRPLAPVVKRSMGNWKQAPGGNVAGAPPAFVVSLEAHGVDPIPVCALRRASGIAKGEVLPGLGGTIGTVLACVCPSWGCHEWSQSARRVADSRGWSRLRHAGDALSQAAIAGIIGWATGWCRVGRRRIAVAGEAQFRIRDEEGVGFRCRRAAGVLWSGRIVQGWGRS
jgi:hypothetical protein